MIKLAKNDDKVVAITVAMPDGTGLKEFREEFPDRFFDVGIAEQHVVTLAIWNGSRGFKTIFLQFIPLSYKELMTKFYMMYAYKSYLLHFV